MAVDRVACPAADGGRRDRSDDDGHPTLLPVLALLPLTELFHSTSRLAVGDVHPAADPIADTDLLPIIDSIYFR